MEMMSNPSHFPQRPSPVVVQRQKSKKLMCLEEHLTRQLSNISNNEGYHGVESASVPFVWESQPGTPKVRFIENFLLPPLTPPPSYQQNVTTKKPLTKAKIKNSPKKASSILLTIFPKRGTRKACVISPPPHESPPLSYYSSSSSSLSSFSPRRLSYSVPSSPMVHSRKGEEEEDTYEGPRSSLCFGNARSRRCYSSIFKKVMLGDFM